MPEHRQPRTAFHKLCGSLVGLALAAVSLVAGLPAQPARTAWAKPESPAAANVSCRPLSFSVEPGESQQVDIYVDNVDGLFGADVRLAFDAADVQVVDHDPVAAGIQIQILDTFLSPDFVVRKNADNTAGTIWYAATQITPSQPVTGEGPLARITFTADRALISLITVTSVELVDKNGSELPSTSQGCVIKFQDEPEPMTVLLPAIMGSGKNYDFTLLAPVVMSDR